VFTKKQALLHFLSEFEVLFSKVGDSLYWRRRELRNFSVSFGKELSIGRNFYIAYPKHITLGERVALGDNVQLVNHAPIEIGDDFTGANDLIINSGTHDPLTMLPRGESIKIGNRVWCGVRVAILAGVTIGNDVVIGAGSVVNNDIPSNSLAVGVPARVICKLDRSSIGELWTWSEIKRITTRE
jgi:maltose O-acetyltransferase